MKRRILLLVAALLVPVARGGDTPGHFDYYVLSLSWSPEYCATSGRSQYQCARPYAFVAHGLWPQHENGSPSDCKSKEVLSDTTINRVLPLMPSRGLIIHEWRKHGACSGLKADAYFSQLERSYRAIKIPTRYQHVSKVLSLSVTELRHDLLSANPSLSNDALVVQCTGRHLKEVRICLDRELIPRPCGIDLSDRCGERVLLRPIRASGR